MVFSLLIKNQFKKIIMNRKILSLLFVVGIFTFFSCADDELSPIITFDKAGKGAYVRLLQETDSKLINLFDINSLTYTYDVEFVDLEQGALVSEYNLSLVVEDKTPDNGADVSTGPVAFRSYSSSDFSTNSNGFAGLEGITITSPELLSAAGINPEDLGPGDEFQIIGTITTVEGQTFGAANSSAAVRGDAFQGHFNYTFAASCPSSLEGSYPYDGFDYWCGEDPSSGTVTVTAIGAGVYTFDDWSLGAYPACYGGLAAGWGTLAFSDVCAEVFFSGFTDNYGDTWEFTSSLEGDKWTITWVNTYGEAGSATITNPSGAWPFTLR